MSHKKMCTDKYIKKGSWRSVGIFSKEKRSETEPEEIDADNDTSEGNHATG